MTRKLDFGRAVAGAAAKSVDLPSVDALYQAGAPATNPQPSSDVHDQNAAAAVDPEQAGHEPAPIGAVVAPGQLDTHKEPRQSPSGPRAHSEAKRPSITRREALTGQTGPSVEETLLPASPDTAKGVRINVPMAREMAEWIHIEAYRRGTGVRGKSALVRECVDRWLDAIEAMTPADRAANMRSLRIAPAPKSPTLYIYGISRPQHARLTPYAADFSTRLPMAVMIRASVDACMRTVGRHSRRLEP